MAARASAQLCAAAAARSKLVVLLCAAAALVTVVAAGGDGDDDVATYSFPAFDNTTTRDLVAATNSSVLEPASLIFDTLTFPSPLLASYNRSEGFLLLAQTVGFWRAGAAGGADVDEASFNCSFTLVAGAPVSFVVLRDVFPTFRAPGGLRGFANYTMPAGGPEPTSATFGSLAVVDVDAVRSYDQDVYVPDVRTAGLNVTVSPRGGGGGCAVWIEYDAGAHRLSVYVAATGGDPAPRRPAKALLDEPLGVGWRWTTETALVGFFAGAIGDIIIGVRNWELTVERLPGDGKKGASWWVVLLAVLGSVAAAAAVVAAAVCYFHARRRRRQRQLNNTMDPKI